MINFTEISLPRELGGVVKWLIPSKKCYCQCTTYISSLMFLQITTTPSLFSVGDIKYGNKTSVVNIVATFPWGQQTVETITLNSTDGVSTYSLTAAAVPRLG